MALITLSRKGWLSAPVETADKLISYFFVADISQSVTWRQYVKSLPYLVQQYGGDPNSFKEQVMLSVEALLNNYFPGSQVMVDVLPVANDNTLYNISISASFTDGINRYDLTKIKQVKNSSLQNVIQAAG